MKSTRYWYDINIDYMDEHADNGFVTTHIDGYKKNIEQGEVIAKIHGKTVKGEHVVFVDYIDHYARVDPYAQNRIEAAKQNMHKYLHKKG